MVNAMVERQSFDHGSAAGGDRPHRSRLLERRGLGAARHLPPDGEGSLRRAAAEARRPSPAAASDRLPDPDGRRPSRTKPRPSKVGELTAAFPRLASAAAGTPIQKGGSALRSTGGHCGARHDHMGSTASEPTARRQRIIERPRLTRLLDESPARVKMLVAPAGYGKTTLARQWLAGKSAPIDLGHCVTGLRGRGGALRRSLPRPRPVPLPGPTSGSESDWP